MKSKEDDLWIATFGDVTKYIRERMNSEINTETTVQQMQDSTGYYVLYEVIPNTGKVNLSYR